MDRLEGYFSQWVINYRGWIIAVSLLVLLAAGNGLQYLGFDNDYRVFLPMITLNYWLTIRLKIPIQSQITSSF